MDPIALGHLAVWRHPAETTPVARLILVHGISEHSGRHLGTIRALNAIGIEVVRFDMRGAGLSGGRRQWVARFSDYVADLVQIYNWCASELSPLPLFVMGHSLGGAVATHFAAQYGKLFHGLILSAPAYRTGTQIPPLKILLGRLLVRFLPTLRLKNGPPTALSRDPRVHEAYRADPLSSHFNTLQQGDVVLKALKEMPDKCRLIGNPTVIFHGTADRVILAGPSFELLQALASRDKELHYLPSAFHEPHLDLGSEQYFTMLCRWIKQHLPVEKSVRASKISEGKSVPEAQTR